MKQTAKIVNEIRGNGGFNNFNKWNLKEVIQWVKSSYGCSTYVAKNVAISIT